VREILKLGGILTLITVIAASALANVYLITKDRIDQVELAKEETARMAALPGASFFVKDSTAGGFIFYRGYADSLSLSGLLGYVLPVAGKGYSSTILAMAGVDTTLTLTGIKIASQSETPGLGTKVEEIKRGQSSPWFQDQFKGKKIEELEVVQGKNPQRIEAITGATISSRAVTNSVRQSLVELKAALAKQ
jgi:Na+-translocating ferredoxin:NAD+ oxidoreductase subunit G